VDASRRIDEQIAGLGDWRGKLIAELRALIRDADPEIAEDWKWDTAVFVKRGNLCAVGAFKDHVKLNFFKGAQVPDSNRLFNSGLDAKTSRAIDFQQGDKVNKPALKKLVQDAAALNAAAKKK
jgi:hypothetical protein